MINTNSAWARAAILLAFATLTPTALTAKMQPRLITQDNFNVFGNRQASTSETLKIWVPKGKAQYQVKVRAPQIWALDYPEKVSAHSDNDTFISIRLLPPSLVLAGSYPVEVELHELDSKGNVVHTELFHYNHEIKSQPRLEINQPSEESLYISTSSYERVDISVKNTGTSVLELRPSNSNTAKVVDGYSWPLVLEVNETARIPVEVASYLYPNAKEGSLRFNLALKDTFTERQFSQTISYNTYEDGGVRQNWFHMPHTIKFANFFREKQMDRGLILKGKGPLSPKGRLQLDYEARWRDIYQNKDHGLSGRGYAHLSDSQTGVALSAGDLNLSSKGLIGKGEKGRSVQLHKDTGNLRFQAYHQTSWDYLTNSKDTDNRARRAVEVGYHFQDRSYVTLRGFDEQDANKYTEHLKILDLELQKTLFTGSSIFAEYAHQFSGKSAVSTDPQSSTGHAAKAQFNYGKPQTSLSMRAEYGSPTYQGALNDVAKASLTHTQRFGKLSTGLQVYYVYNNLKNNALATSSLIDESLLARMGYVFNKAFNVTSSVKLESSRTHVVPGLESEYRRGLARVDAVVAPLKSIRLNLRGEMEGHNYYNLNRKTTPLYNGTVRINYSPLSMFNCYASCSSQALVSTLNDNERQKSYSYGFNIDNRKDAQLSVNWSNKFLNNSENHSVFINYACKITRNLEGHFRISASHSGNDDKIYDGQFSLERKFKAPLYKPSAQHPVAVNLTLPADFEAHEPLLLQAGTRTVRVDKSGKYDAMIAGSKGQLFFINLPNEYLTERAIPPLFAGKGASKTVNIAVVKASYLTVNLQQSDNVASSLIDPKKDMERLNKFIKHLPIELENRLTGEIVTLTSTELGNFQSGKLRPGKWRISLPDPVFPQLAFELTQNEITITPGQEVNVDIKLISKERKFRVLSRAS